MQTTTYLAHTLHPRSDGDATMRSDDRPIRNPYVLLREEFDDWAVLFNPDTGYGFGLNPTGVYLWKLLDGHHSLDDLLEALRRDADTVPQEAGEQIVVFLADLAEQGLAGCGGEETQRYRAGTSPYSNRASGSEPAEEKESLIGLLLAKRFVYATPCLVSLNEYRFAQGKCHYGHLDAGGPCTTGSGVLAGNCGTGYAAPSACSAYGYGAVTCTTGSGT